MDTRSNKPRVTLLHFLVDEIRTKTNGEALEFVNTLARPLAVAAK